MRYPPHIWVTWQQPNPKLVANVELIRSRAREQRRRTPRLHSVDSLDHSIRLVDNHDVVRAFVLDTIRSYPRGGP